MLKSLKILYIPFCAALFFIFHISYVSANIPYAFVNIIFVSIAPFGYVYKSVHSYIFALLSWPLFYPLFTSIYKKDPLNAALPILIFNCLLIGFARFKNMVEEDRIECDSKIEEREDVKNRSQEEFERLDGLETLIREKELAVVRLYEITKKMSESLRFDSIFNTFSAFLKENFKFRKAELIILKGAEGLSRIDRTYKVWAGKGRAEEDIDHNEVLKLFLEDREAAYLTRERNQDFFKALRVKDEVETFGAISLLSENKVVGILTIENLPHLDLDRFVILAVQFALEIKKVLLYETVEELAITDSLTGLYVRRYFFERVNEELNRSRRYKFEFAFLMMDIDDFKKVNDTYGHLVGDVVLKEIAIIMKENTRQIDLVARYGGEEFSLALPETGREAALLVGERIRKRIEENTFRAYDERLNVTISVGISIYPDDSTEPSDIVDKADKALYAAKAAGKNIVWGYKK